MRRSASIAPGNRRDAEREKKDSCRHYWLIEAATGPTSRGRCKYCGAKREFQNFLPDLTWDSWVSDGAGPEVTVIEGGGLSGTLVN